MLTKNHKKIIILIILLFLVNIFSYNKKFINKTKDINSRLLINNSQNEKEEHVIENNDIFNPNKNALVFLHIPKTSGTFFDEFIIENIKVKDEKAGWIKPCKVTGSFLAKCTINIKKNFFLID